MDNKNNIYYDISDVKIGLHTSVMFQPNRHGPSRTKTHMRLYLCSFYPNFFTAVDSLLK